MEIDMLPEHAGSSACLRFENDDIRIATGSYGTAGWSRTGGRFAQVELRLLGIEIRGEHDFYETTLKFLRKENPTRRQVNAYTKKVMKEVLNHFQEQSPKVFFKFIEDMREKERREGEAEGRRKMRYSICTALGL